MAEASTLPALPAPGREAECDFLPSRDYGLIGGCRGAALGGGDGSVDWCCFERFDAEPIFARLLDRQRGSFLLLHPKRRSDASIAPINQVQCCWTRRRWMRRCLSRR
jgi:hypothetical protein